MTKANTRLGIMKYVLDWCQAHPVMEYIDKHVQACHSDLYDQHQDLLRFGTAGNVDREQLVTAWIKKEMDDLPRSPRSHPRAEGSEA